MIPVMVVDDSERTPKVRFYSDPDGQSEPSFVKLPRRGSLRRTASAPTSFKEKKKCFNAYKRSKMNSDLSSSANQSPFQSLSNMESTQRRNLKRKLLAPIPENRDPEPHDLRRWAYATRDEYNRYLIPRTSTTESNVEVARKAADYDDDCTQELFGLAFVDETTD